MSDPHITWIQNWLNETYGSVPGWGDLEVTGRTGWPTMYALRRSLQFELGIETLGDGFGDQTKSAFISQIGRIDNGTTDENLLRLVSGSLWCKGHAGIYEEARDDAEPVTFDEVEDGVANARENLGLDADETYVDVKLMASLMSMDADRIPLTSDGTQAVRDVQQWLNATYSNRRDFELGPTDGMFSRQVQKSMMFALQYEFGMDDDTANGNFGPGTRAGLRDYAQVGPGSTDGESNFVRLYQGAMRFNLYEVPFSGSFDDQTSSMTSDFQSFMEIPISGEGDYTTWANLLVSSGDTSISTEGFDTSMQLTVSSAHEAVENGYTHVGRYIVGAGKFLTTPELYALKDSGLRVWPIHQRFNNEVRHMTYSNGYDHGIEAMDRARVLGLPDNVTLYFSVDFDPVDVEIEGPVREYFQGVNDALALTCLGDIRVGIYGTRNVCQIIIDAELAKAAFVSGMSTGFSGNMGVRMPEAWHYNQIVELSEEESGFGVNIDKVVVSSKADAVNLDNYTPPPEAVDRPITDTGFDYVYEWIAEAESACERALVEESTVGFDLTFYTGHIPTAVAHQIRLDDYWSSLWRTYTNISSTATDERSGAALGTCLSTMSEVQPSRPTSDRDVTHWAATFLGYHIWGISSPADSFRTGDLGGWALDLLQAWGVYAREGQPGDVYDWMETNLGKSDESAFGYDDLVADADAYLCAAMMQNDGVGQLSSAMRNVYQQDAASRLARFYNDRFGQSSENVASAMENLVGGMFDGSFPVPIDLLRDAAGLNPEDEEGLPMPSNVQAQECGRALGTVLAQLGQ